MLTIHLEGIESYRIVVIAAEADVRNGLRELAAGVPCVGAEPWVRRGVVELLRAVVVVNVLVGVATVVRHGNGIVSGELALLIEHLYHVDVVVLVVLLVVLDGTPVYYELSRLRTVGDVVCCAMTVIDKYYIISCIFCINLYNIIRCSANFCRRHQCRVGNQLILISICCVGCIVEGEEAVARLTREVVYCLYGDTANVVKLLDRSTAILTALWNGSDVRGFHKFYVVGAGVAVNDTQAHLARRHVVALLVEGYNLNGALCHARFRFRYVVGIGALALHAHIYGGERGDIVQSGELGYGHRG